MENKLEYKFKLEWIMALLQGKELHLTDEHNEIVFYPPQGGIFMTHEQFDDIKRNIEYEAEKRLLKMLEDINVNDKLEKVG